MVRFKPPVPAIAGLFGKPTIVNNVVSLSTVPVILERGAAFYKDYGMGRSRGTLPIQLAGNVKHPGLVEKAFGVTLRDLVEDYGGGTWSGRPLRAVQVGGPLGAYFPRACSTCRWTTRRLRRRRGLSDTAELWSSTIPLTSRSRRAGRSSSARSSRAASARRAVSDRPAAPKSSTGFRSRTCAARTGDREAAMGLLRDLCDTMTLRIAMCAGRPDAAAGAERAAVIFPRTLVFPGVTWHGRAEC